MFESTGPVTLFDYFRVPYEQNTGDAPAPGTVTVAAPGRSATLRWPTASAASANGRRARSFYVDSIRIFGHVASDTDLRDLVGQRDRGEWRSVHEVRDDHGLRIGAVWQKDDGDIVLPFDPNELIANFWTERYLSFVRTAVTKRVSSLARRAYYRARPLLPRGLQMKVRRSFSRVQSRTTFPRWPIETGLHDFYDFLFGLVTGIAERPVPFIAPWPGEWSWALVLTHDVETQIGYENLRELLQAELDAGYRSSWNFVPRNRYVVEDDLVKELWSSGFEVGVHGLYHDGRDLASPSTLQRRLPAMRSAAERWEAIGFRSPGTLRSAELMPRLGFEYDSSYSDTAPFEPQPGGCCTWLPYMIDDLVELPITLAQDHTLFDLLNYRDESLWLEKARFVRDRSGMALILTHSDYVANRNLLESYRRFLDEFSDDSSAWKALPREVSDWWRRRARSELREVDGEWRVVGPAEDDARVEYASPAVLHV